MYKIIIEQFFTLSLDQYFLFSTFVDGEIPVVRPVAKARGQKLTGEGKAEADNVRYSC